MSYTLAGITIEEGIVNNVKYLSWGDANAPTIVYLHGIGERGTNSLSMLNQGPLRRKYDHLTGTYSGWEHSFFFTLGFRVVYPQLTSDQSIWTAKYLDNFLDGINLHNNKFLTGWSLGGGGTVRYLNQLPLDRKHTFKAGFAIAPAYDAGNNINIPLKLVHAIDDKTVSVTNSDKIKASSIGSIVEYNRLTGGGHWIETSQWAQSFLYTWLKSFIQETQTPTETEGKVVKIGSEVFAVFGQEKIKLA